MLRLWIRFRAAMCRAAADERGDLQQWLPVLIGVGIAVALLIAVYLFAQGNLGPTLSNLWGKITNP